jgi:hypothetical protein
VLSISLFLIYAGMELIGFMLGIIYLGAILIFFIFVVMLIDLRFEDLQDIYEEAKTFEPQSLTIFYPLIMFMSLMLLNILTERILFTEYFGLESFLLELDTLELAPSNFDLLTNYFATCALTPAAIGFSLFAADGGSVGILSIILLFSLYLSLYTVQVANESVMLRLEASSLKHATKKVK